MAKETVENCQALNVNFLKKAGWPRPDKQFGTLAPGLRAGKISWAMEGNVLHLTYTPRSRRAAAPGEVMLDVQIDRSIQYNGERTRFLCPQCGRRCQMLFLPPSDHRFLCRSCHNLTYESMLKRKPAALRAYLRLEERCDQLREEYLSLPMNSPRRAQLREQLEEVRAKLALEVAQLTEGHAMSRLVSTSEPK